MPKSRQGSRATITIIIVRLESILSWIWTPERDVSLGVNRKVSNPSNTEWRAWNLPPSLKCGRALSSIFFNAFISEISRRFGLVHAKLIQAPCEGSQGLRALFFEVQVLRCRHIRPKRNPRGQPRRFRVAPFGRCRGR